MSVMLADIDATCASLGYYDGKIYVADPDSLQGLKVNIFYIGIKIKVSEFNLYNLFNF